MIQIGPLQLQSNLFLAPLAGYTNLPFRLAVRELGHLGLATTDLVNARSLIEKNSKAIKLIESCPLDRPLAVQLFGSVPEEMRDAALVIQSLGVDIVDINMGCPVRKVCQVGGGSAMMTSQDKTTSLVAGIVKAVKIPVTVKMRLGWDKDNITAPDLARALEDVGVSAVTIHGRTRDQGFSGRVQLDGIRSVVHAVRAIPVIGNGDMTTPQAARAMIQQTGCAGVSIGRGAFYNPWIFAHTSHFLQTGELLPDPSFEERVRFMRRHLDLMVQVFGEVLGCKMFRKIAPWYARSFGPSKEFTRKIVLLSSRAEFEVILQDYLEWRQQFLDQQGRLLPKYLPAPMTASFMEEEGTAAVEAIRVPAGPCELW